MVACQRNLAFQAILLIW
uniref:Uncharacterized protein n=1 Tax=Rhizophora mucronata TaxID=61149 RepID=A0A2P2NK56_RHIMU